MPDINDDLQPGDSIIVLDDAYPRDVTVHRVYKHGRSLTVIHYEGTTAQPGRHSAWEVRTRVMSWQVVDGSRRRLYRPDGSRIRFLEDTNA